MIKPLGFIPDRTVYKNSKKNEVNQRHKILTTHLIQPFITTSIKDIQN